MHLRIRFIGRALEYLQSQGHEDRRFTQNIAPELVQVGDLVRHPLFPDRNIYVVAREIDLVERCVTAWLDELPGSNETSTRRTEAQAASQQESAFPRSAGDD